MQFSQRFILPLTCIAETMAAIGPVAMDEALKKGSSDLRFTLSRNDVTDQLQAAFFNKESLQFRSSRAFSGLKPI